MDPQAFLAVIPPALFVLAVISVVQWRRTRRWDGSRREAEEAAQAKQAKISRSAPKPQAEPEIIPLHNEAQPHATASTATAKVIRRPVVRKRSVVGAAVKPFAATDNQLNF